MPQGIRTEDPPKPEGPTQTDEKRGDLDSTKEPKLATARRLLALEQKISESERLAIGYLQYVRQMKMQGKKPMSRQEWRKQRGCPFPEEGVGPGAGRRRGLGPDPTHYFPGPWGPYGGPPGPGDSP